MRNGSQNRDINNGSRGQYETVIRWLWIILGVGIFSIVTAFIYLSYQDLPTFEELENPKSNLASEVYAADGTTLGRYYIENRVPVSYEELSPQLIKAFVATEDERYYKHSGIDGQALGRVLIKTVLLRQKSAGGASTITQQLAKMLFTQKPGSGLERVVQKLKEWIIAVKLERAYTKEEIMAMYLNKFNFINGAYGIKAAAEIYFGKKQDELNTEEAATLVGMLKNPSLYNPVRRPELVLKRRSVVLNQMKKNDFISNASYDSLKNVDLGLNFNRSTHTDGPAPYFRMKLGEEIKEILSKQAYRKADGSKYDIYRDGLRIYTTLDPNIQKHAEESAVEHMSKLQKRFDKVWSKKDPWTYDDPTKETEENENIDAARKKTLTRLIRETDRYKSLREAYLTPLTNEIANIIDGFNLRDVDIERMLKEYGDKGSLTRLVSRKIIGSPLALKYKTVMGSSYWPELRKQWNILKDKTETAFSQKVKMRVFAYNEEMEKDTVMTPLDSIKYHRQFLQIGSVAVDPQTGHVKAWVGGINHKYFQFDHVTSDRQVGSTFKPFIYATAIAQQGFSPCYQVLDIPYTIHVGEANFTLYEDWTPQNANGEYSGKPYTLFKGLQYSKNTVSVFLMKQLGNVEPVRNLVDNMGLDKNRKRPDGIYRIPQAPSICLGSSDLTVMEIAGAYTTFANNGRSNKPIFISKIEDNDGRQIYLEIPESKTALNPHANYVMVEMLRSVMRQGLPGFSNIKSDIGGKTGTTNDYVDGWFVGLSPQLIVATWVGGDDRWIRFLSLRDGIGAKMARPFYAKLLSRLENDTDLDWDTSIRFQKPRGELGFELDCEMYSQDNIVGAIPESEGENIENESFGEDLFGDEDPQMPNDSLQEDEEFLEEF